MDSDDEFAGMDDLPLDEATFREIDQRTMEYMSQIAVDAAPNASQGAGTFANLKEMNVYSMPPGDNRMMPYQHDGEISTLKRKLADLQSDNLKLKESQNGLHFKHQKEFEALQLDYESKVKKLETEMRFKDQELYTYKLSQPRHTSMRDGGTVTKESRDAGVMTDVELEQSPISSTPGHKAAEAFSVEKRLKDILFKTYAELKDSGPTNSSLEYTVQELLKNACIVDGSAQQISYSDIISILRLAINDRKSFIYKNLLNCVLIKLQEDENLADIQEFQILLELIVETMRDAMSLLHTGSLHQEGFEECSQYAFQSLTILLISRSGDPRSASFFFASVFPLGVGDQLPTTTFISFATFCFDFLGTPRKLEGSTWMSQLFRAIGRHLLDVSSAPNKEAVISASASLSMLIIRKFAADLNGDKAFFTTIKVFVEVLEATASLLPSTGKLPPGLCDIIFIVLYAKENTKLGLSSEWTMVDYMFVTVFHKLFRKIPSEQKEKVLKLFKAAYSDCPLA